MKMLKAICPKCKTIYFGWALKEEKNRICQCGGKLHIKKEKENDRRTDKRD